MRTSNSGLGHGTYGSAQVHVENGRLEQQVSSIEASTLSAVEQNAESMKETYPLTPSGYFGEKGKNVRIIKSPDPITTARDFYSRIRAGGDVSPLPNGKGTMTKLSDGTLIVYREVTSTPGSPAVEITVSGSKTIKNQKIHFVR